MKFKKSTFDKATDISKTRTSEFNIPLINAKFGDNGIMYYGRKNDFETASMTIDIVNDGAISTASVYPQPQETGVLYNAYLIKPLFDVNNQILYFLSTTIQKSIKEKFGYENKAGWEKVKKEFIQLPTKDGKIDFDFMDAYISELEEERISELTAYLTVSGLDNYELSSEEKKALENLKLVQWEEYNLEKLFGKATRGRRLKSQDRIKGVLPFVTAGEANTGISDFIGNDVKVFDKNTITIDMFGSAKYRNYNYGCDDHIAVVHTENLKMEESIFITSAIHKTSYNGQFNYGRNFYAKDADTLNILLPINEKGIDYDFMNSLISAVQKLVIKEVVIYADEKIKTTKKVVRKD